MNDRHRLLPLIPLVAASVLLATFIRDQTSPPPELPDDPFAPTMTFDARRFVGLLNDYRAANGQGSLRLDAALTRAARQHAEWCQRTNSLGHEGENGSTFDQRAVAAGYAGRPVTENFAFLASEPGPAELLDVWQRSPGHDAGLKMPATECGIWVTPTSPSFCVWLSGSSK